MLYKPKPQNARGARILTGLSRCLGGQTPWTVELSRFSTVKSIQRGDFPTRRAAAARAAPSTPRLVSAARVGPVVYGLLLAFRGDGYG